MLQPGRMLADLTDLLRVGACGSRQLTRRADFCYSSGNVFWVTVEVELARALRDQVLWSKRRNLLPNRSLHKSNKGAGMESFNGSRRSIKVFYVSNGALRLQGG